MMSRMLLLRAVGWFVIGVGVCVGAPQEPSSRARSDWFETGSIPEVRIRLEPAAMERLRVAPRQYVVAKLREGKEEPREVGVKLKGSAGSFRSFDDKPGLTIDANRFEKDGEFHDLVKFHLNNAVQDGTYLQEFLAYEIFRRAKLPAPRVTHARVWINERDLGLYVLKEAYDRRFLRRSFEDSDGNLYDGGVNGEVHDDLERDVGRGRNHRRDLKALAEACDLSAGSERRRRLEACLDVDQFITFMAAEVMIGHWDGYTLNPNNYRLYFGRREPRGVFIIHGADQVFQDATASIFSSPQGTVARVVLSEPVWRKKYRDRMKELLPIFHPPTALVARVRARAARLRPVVARTMSASFVRKLAARQRELEGRVAARGRFLVEEIQRGGPDVFDVKKAGSTLR